MNVYVVERLHGKSWRAYQPFVTRTDAREFVAIWHSFHRESNNYRVRKYTRAK